jgi:uncharacterized lipoprotein YajG
MKKVLLFLSGLILMVSCSTPQAVSVGSQKPNSSRVAYIYEDKVVIVTKSEFTKEQYAQLVALRNQNKEN